MLIQHSDPENYVISSCCIKNEMYNTEKSIAAYYNTKSRQDNVLLQLLLVAVSAALLN